MNLDSTPQLFRGRTLHEARLAATQALGAQAVIVATREVRKPGPFGWLAGKSFEVAAAKPEPPEMPSRPSAPRLPFATGVYDDTPPKKPEQEELTNLRNEIRRELRALRSVVTQPKIPNEILEELAVLRAALEDYAPQKQGKKADRVAALLRSRGIEGPAAGLIAKHLASREGDDVDVQESFREAITQLVRVTPSPLASKGKAIVAFVGPTGVGKTTTAAKLAARAILELGKTVTLVSCDNFRIGAVDQLRRYAELLSAKFATAHTRAALEQIIATATTDLVIIDTAGHGPQSAEGPESYFTQPRRKDDGVERHVVLCLPASLRSLDAQRMAKTFGDMHPTSLAVTKLDETDAPSGVLHAAVATKVAVSILCFGQRVPEDIAPATMGALLDHLSKQPLGGAAGKGGSGAKS